MLFQDAHRLYGTAREMRFACEVLASDDGSHKISVQNRQFMSTIHFLMGFSVDLYLKAALAQAGVNEHERYGHDLQVLFDKAENMMLLKFPVIGDFRKLVEILSNDHKKFSFRYLKKDSVVAIVTTIPAALLVLKILDDHLRQNLV